MSEAKTASGSTAARPLVAIGLPCYNSERYLAKSIESLLGQTFRDLELIICDNASTDGTPDICRKYAALDPRVKYHRNETNIGMNPNFNRTFQLSDSKYFKFSTADDYWAPEMVADAVEVLESDETIVLCHPHATIIDSEGRVQGQYEDDVHLMQEDPAERFEEYYKRVGLCNHHLGVLRSSAIRHTRLFGPQVGADYGFLGELALYGKFHQVPKHQFFRRFHENSSSWNKGDEEQAARRFYAADIHRLAFPSWRTHAQRFRAVLRSPLPLRSKLRLFRFLAKHFYWDREDLGKELRYDVPLLFHRARRSAKPE